MILAGKLGVYQPGDFVLGRPAYLAGITRVRGGTSDRAAGATSARAAGSSSVRDGGSTGSRSAGDTTPR